MTPTKRKRLSSDASLNSIDGGGCVAGPSGVSTPEKTPRAARTTVGERHDGHAKKSDEAHWSPHTNMELYQYTFTKAGIAPCFANDILNMKTDECSAFAWHLQTSCS